MKYRLVLLFSLSLVLTIANGQVQFEVRNDLLIKPDQHSAVPVGIADVNADGFDDIITLDGGVDLVVQFQTPDPNRPFVSYVSPVNIDQAEQNDIMLADFNNDGATDIAISGSYDRLKILYSIPHTYNFNVTYVVVDPFFSQGASAGDFNGDGWVDIVFLNDNGENYAMINDGAGNFDLQPYFNFTTVPVSDNSGNYGSLYTDFDMDGDLDFYIAKCRQGVTNPLDPRRIDVLFVNDGNNHYTQDAKKYGLADGHQTWTADFGDIDNDGDMDLFKTEHDILCVVAENIENDTFIDITSQSKVNIGGVGLQGMIRDFDNDGWQDLIVSGDLVEFWHNNGDKTFTRQTPFGGTVFGTFALGDVNHDGFTDVYASTVIPFNNPDISKPDVLYMGVPNGNHFISLDLMQNGVNPSAIGAKAILYSELGIQVREVRSGEQYGVSNSHNMIFGMGSHTTYDSLVIQWPDGIRETYNQLLTDQKYTIRKGGCDRTSMKVWPPLMALCGNDSIKLSLDGLNIVSWSTGSTADSIFVKTSGLYFATVIDDVNCLIRTEPIEVIVNPDTVKPSITYEGNTQLCHFDQAILSLPFGVDYQWSNGENSNTIIAKESGDYFASVAGFCKTQQSDTIHLEFLTPDAPEVTNDTFSLGETAVLSATGDSVIWSTDPYGVDVIGYGNTLSLLGLTDDATVYAQNLSPIPGQDYAIGQETQHGNPKYNGTFINGGLQFTVLDPIFLKSFTVYTDSVGARIIEITGPGFFFDKQVDLVAGANVIDLNIDIPEGAYIVSTNTDLNNLQFGVNSPYLWRSSEQVDYPYEIDGIVSIDNSTFGAEFYYYFYDWQISTSDRYCGSDFSPATALLDIHVATNNASEDKNIQILPNPTAGVSHIITGPLKDAKIEITNSQGEKIILNESVIGNQQSQIDLSGYPSGIYFVRISEGNKSFTKKIVKL